MKHTVSFRTKMALAFAVAVASAVSLCWLLSRFFLKDYYTDLKLENLESCYRAVNQAFGEQMELSEDGDLILEKLSDNGRVSLLVINPGDTGSERYLFTTEYNDMVVGRMLASIQKYLNLSTGQEPYEVLRQDSEKYSIYKLYDEATDRNSIDLFGKLDNGCFVFLRTSYQSITEAADIASRFLARVGIAVILCGAVLVYFISNLFTRPIQQMSEIALRMSHQDFEARYPVRGNDEIGVLGDSMNKLSERLEATIKELKEANNELQKDIQRKVEIDNMRTDFISNVSHELKTPLALIQGYAEGLQENINDDPESREFYCEVIVDEAKKMSRMVKKLLTLHQIEFGQNALELERFDIVAMLRTVLEATDILREQKEVTLHFRETGPVYVWADEYLVEEVVTNYLSNAMNHVAKSKEIAVSLQKMGASVRVSVYNTGEPIPEEELDNIWVKFYKVDKARTREYGGSGIGLSIVKAIMESHNQKYGVINHPGGVEFWFELDAAGEDTTDGKLVQEHDSNH